MFKGLFDTSTTAVVSVTDFLICLGASLVLGLVIAAVYSFRAHFTKSFFITLALLPAAVCIVIMMVNGNVGAGVAVAGAFSLVRFRSVPGSAKEICMLFLAMGTGLITGMGYIGYGALFTVIMCVVYALYGLLNVGTSAAFKTIRITIPEELDYTNVFDDILKTYTKKHELCQVKSTNFGSMFKLTYNVELKDTLKEKEMLDKIRERNGNLEITVSKQETTNSEL